jgi:hypothetical protein
MKATHIEYPESWAALAGSSPERFENGAQVFHPAVLALKLEQRAVRIPHGDLALRLLVLGPASAESVAAHQRIAFPDARLEVCGLPWFSEDKPALRRLPSRLSERVRPPVWDLAQDPSGARLRFRTDSTTIGLVAENPRFSIWYVDGLKMLSPDQAAGPVDGVHCNSLGFYFNALGLEPYLRKALR